MSGSTGVIVPCIHLNGSGAERLFEQNCEAMGAIRAAIQKLQDAAPHGRDYYPLDAEIVGGAYSIARREHEDRIARLRSVLAELEHISESIADAQERRGDSTASRAMKRELRRARNGGG